jgi:hypothetical protein
MKSLLILLALVSSAANVTWKPEYAQLSNQERQWFKDQKNPKTQVPCCSEADGAQAQEDISNGHYRVRFVARTFTSAPDVDSGWMDVPDEAVIQEPNRHGSPVVWYYWKQGSNSPLLLMIRCYAPGAKGSNAR